MQHKWIPLNDLYTFPRIGGMVVSRSSSFASRAYMRWSSLICRAAVAKGNRKTNRGWLLTKIELLIVYPQCDILM